MIPAYPNLTFKARYLGPLFLEIENSGRTFIHVVTNHLYKLMPA